MADPGAWALVTDLLPATLAIVVGGGVVAVLAIVGLDAAYVGLARIVGGK